MNYIFSNYNYYKKNNNSNNCFIFNSLSRKLVCIPQKYIENTELISNENLDLLKKYNYIIEKGQEQLNEIKTITSIKKYDNKVLRLTIIPTNSCNFRCIYCYQPERNSFMTDKTMEGVIKWIENNITFFKELNISWFGGEPLLKKGLIIETMRQIQAICRFWKKPMVASITTNGYELDFESFTKLVSYGVLYYQITIDGGQKTHNKQRPHKTNNDSYSVIINNLKQIKNNQFRKRFEIGIRINISGNMSSESIFQFIDEMEETFSHDKRFVFVWQWVRDWGGERINSYNKDELVKKGDECIEFIEYAQKKGLYSPDIIESTIGADSCEAFYKYGYVINYDGSVFKCAMLMEDYENNCIGYIDNYGRMILNNNENKWLQDDAISKKCEKCPFLPMCLVSRCHYSVKVRSKLKCMEYIDLIDKLIDNMIIRNHYLTLKEAENG